MTNQEKEAIEMFEVCSKYNFVLNEERVKIILNLIKRLQKENEELENDNKYLRERESYLEKRREDITKYAGGLDKTKILNCYKKIPVFLGNENKKFQKNFPIMKD